MTQLLPASPDIRVRSASERVGSTRHFAGLDGLRGVAVIAVIVYHLFPGVLPGGFIGVDIFFVISGFLITSLLVRERAAAGRISLKRFWQRRVRRLVPALVALVLICCSAAWVIGGDVLVGLGRQVLGAATFSNNWLDIAAGSSYFSRDAPELFRNLWSLAVEEQFYLLWPLLLIALLFIRSVRVRIVVLAALAATSGALMWLLFSPNADATRVYFGTDTHSFGLMIGAALALIVRTVKPLDLDAGEGRLQVFVRHWLPSLGIVSFVAVLAASWWLQDDASLTYRGGLVAVSVLTAIVIWSAISPRSVLGRGLDVAPLRYIGERSYGLYLWHWPVLVLVQAAWVHGANTPVRMLSIGLVSLAITVVAAGISYRFVEQPVRRLGFRGVARAVTERIRASRSQRRLAVAGLAVIAVALAGTGAALLVAPAKTGAQAFIERGARAVHQQHAKRPTVPAPTTTPTGSPSPGTSSPPSASSPPSSASEPEHKAIPTGDQMVAVGDSVMLASAPSLQQTFPGIAIDATVSRQMNAAPAIVQAMADAGTLRKVVVVGLGTNGSIGMGALDDIRHIIGPDRELVLITVQAPRDWTASVNDTLRAFAGQNRRTVALADWQSAIATHLDTLAEDQIHPGTSGGQIYAATVQSALQHLADLPPVIHLTPRMIGPTAQ
jgi:peptidoglycan/LPS O-acetylase OafA/YrhL